MKRIYALLLVVFMTLMVACGCSEKKQDVYTVSKDGKEYIVDTVEQTITVDQVEYDYYIWGDSDNYDIKVVFPDKSYYKDGEHTSGAVSVSGLDISSNFNLDNTELGEELFEIAKAEVPKAEKMKPLGSVVQRLLLVVLIGGCGVWNFLDPYMAWKFSEGWRYKNVEPSELALAGHKVSGVILIVIAIGIFLMGC